MVLGDAFCMDFKPYFKVHNLVSVYPTSIILGQMTNLNMIFHVVVSVYRSVKIWNSPQFPDEFRNGQSVSYFYCLMLSISTGSCYFCWLSYDLFIVPLRHEDHN